MVVVAVVLKAVPCVRSDHPQAISVFLSRVLSDRPDVVQTTPSLCCTSSRGKAFCLQFSELRAQR
jgi:hypothetical protein